MTEDGTPGGAALVGDTLRASREAQGLTIVQVSERTRVPRRHLAAIETSDYAALPAIPYAVGFVKSYARALGLPAEEIGRDFRVELNAAEFDRPERYEPAFEPTDPARVPPRWLAVTTLIVAVLFVAGYGVWRSGVLDGTSADQRQVLATGVGADQAPSSPQPAASPTAMPVPAATPASAGGPVVVTATAPAWIRVSDGDRRLFMGVMKPGDRFAVPADAASPIIRTGAPQAIRITVGEAVAPTLGPPSTLVRAASLKPADLLGGHAASAPDATAAVASPSDRPAPVQHRASSVDPRNRMQPADPNAIVPSGGSDAPPAPAPAPAAATEPATPGA